VAEFLHGDGAARVNRGRALKFGRCAVEVALFAEILTLFDVENARFKADLVELNAVVSVLRVRGQCFLVVLQGGVVILQVFRMARGFILVVALGAPCRKQACYGTQNQNQSTAHAHSVNCSQAPTKAVSTLALA
jgi:hypothetical protein